MKFPEKIKRIITNSSLMVRGGLIIGFMIWVSGAIILYSESYKGEKWDSLMQTIPRLTFFFHLALLFVFFGLSLIIWFSYDRFNKISLAYHASENRFKFLLNSISDAVWITDKTRKQILYINPAAKNLFHFDENTKLDSSGEWMRYVHPEDIGRLEDTLQTVEKAGEAGLVYRQVCKDGSIKWLYQRWNSYYDDAMRSEVQGTFVTNITKLREGEESIKKLTQSLLNAQEDERHHIARDLHDHIAQGLMSVKLNCENLLDSDSREEKDIKTQETLHKMADNLSLLMSDVRNISIGLHPPELDQLGLILTLNEYCKQFEKENDIQLEFQSAALSELRMDSKYEINIFRIVQEALNNIRKHSLAKNASVKIVRQGALIIIRIEDDGKGFNVSEQVREALVHKHMGIKSMEERVHLLGGEFDLKSRVNMGSKILIRLPFKEKIHV